VTAPTSFDAEMRAALATGEPLLDNVTDPHLIGAYGIEGPGSCTCPLLPGEHLENECGALTWKATR
jgi:hypothetical protein